MITRHEDLPVTVPALSMIGADESGCVFFDIETTGFRASFSQVYLIGAAYHTASGWKVIQWMCENRGEENGLLLTFAAFLKPFSTLLHFNGNRFDIPYLEEKYRSLGMDSPLSHLRSVDILQTVRPLRALLGLDHMNQKALEVFLGCGREDLFTGGELIEVYKDYCRSHDTEKESLLLLHNLEDVKNMPALTGLFSYLQLSGEPDSISGRLIVPGRGEGFAPSDCPDPSEGAPAPAALEITVTCPLSFPVPLVKGFPWGTVLLSECTVCIRVNVFTGRLLHFFENYRDYYYLPREDEAIHKSVASFVDKDYRVRATARTCYTKKTGSFLPVFGETALPCFQSDYNDRQRWILLPEDACSRPFLSGYLDGLKKIIMA